MHPVAADIAAQADAQRLLRLPRHGEGVRGHHADAGGGEKAGDLRPAPARGQAQPDVERVGVGVEIRALQQGCGDVLARGRLGADEAADGVGGAVLDPAGGQGHGQGRGHDVGGFQAPRQLARRPRVGRDGIGQAQPGADAFGQPPDMPDPPGRHGGEGGGRVGGDEAVGVILDQRQVQLLQRGGDFEAAAFGDGAGGGVVERGVEVERPGPVGLGRLAQRLGQDAVAVPLHADKAQAQPRGDAADARIGHRFAQDRVALARQLHQKGEHGGVRAGGDGHALQARGHAAHRQPGGGGFAVHHAAGRGLVAQEADEIVGHGAEPVAHAGEQFGILRLGRQVHRQIALVRAARIGGFGRAGPGGDEGAAADMRLHQPAGPRLGIPAGDGGEVDAEGFGEAALGRQAVAGAQAPGLHVAGYGVGEGEVTRRAVLCGAWGPAHDRGVSCDGETRGSASGREIEGKLTG